MQTITTLTINGSQYHLTDAVSRQAVEQMQQSLLEQSAALEMWQQELQLQQSAYLAQLEKQLADVAPPIVCTATGSDIILQDAAQRPLRGLKLSGTADKSSITVQLTGRNIFDLSTMKAKNCVISGNMFYAVYTYSAANIPVIPGQTYTISAYVKAEKVHTGLLTLSVQDGADVGYGKGTSLGSRAGATTEWKKVSITFTALSDYVSISTNAQVRKDDVMVEPGTVATDYVPYSLQTLTVPYAGETIDFAKGVTVHSDGSETALSADTLAAFAALRTNKPVTCIRNDAGVDMEVTYVADTKTYIDRKENG